MFTKPVAFDDFQLTNLDQLSSAIKPLVKTKKVSRLSFLLPAHTHLVFQQDKDPKKLNISLYGNLSLPQVEKIRKIVASKRMQSEIYSPFYHSPFGLAKHYQAASDGEKQAKIQMMHPLCDHNKKLLINFLPKNACTFTKYWFMHNTSLKISKPHEEKVHLWYREKHLPSIAQVQIPDPKLAKQYFTAMLIRNPYSRIVSSFLQVLEHGGLRKQLSDALNLTSEQVKSLTFRQFLEGIKKVDLDQCDGHLRRQVSGCMWNHPKNIDYIIRVESIRDDLLYLHQRFAYPIENIKFLETPKNVKGKAPYISGKHCADIPLNQLKGAFSEIRSDLYPHVLNFYTKDIKKKVESLFARDIKVLNYRFDDIH